MEQLKEAIEDLYYFEFVLGMFIRMLLSLSRKLFLLVDLVRREVNILEINR